MKKHVFYPYKDKKQNSKRKSLNQKKNHSYMLVFTLNNKLLKKLMNVFKELMKIL